MSYNGGLEDPQNWPFSVRYTASPYRKSKFPVDPTVKSGVVVASSRENNGPAPTSSSSTSSDPQHLQFQQSSQNQQPQQSSWLLANNETTTESTLNSPSSSSSSYPHHRAMVPSNSGVPGGGLGGVINSSGLLMNRSSSGNGSTTTTSTSSSSNSSQNHLGALFPLHQVVVPHHQANQPLFAQAQAVLNYHNTQNNNSSTNGGGGNANFRQHLHNHHQRQLQFQKGGLGLGVGSRLGGNNMSSFETAHLHHQYQNHQEKQRILQQRLLVNSSNLPGVHAHHPHPHPHHPFLVKQGSASVSGVGVKGQLPDHNHYGLPMSSGGGTTTPGPGGIAGPPFMQRLGQQQQMRQGNTVWHLLSDNKDLDQVEGLDEGYIEDLKQPFLFHHPHQQQHQQHHPTANANLPPSSSAATAASLSASSQIINNCRPLNLPQQTVPFNPTSVIPPHLQGSSVASSRAQEHHFLGHPGRKDNQLPIGFAPGDRDRSAIEYDPYSYVYDSHIQDDLLHRNGQSGTVDLRNLHNFVDSTGGGASKVLLAATLSNTSSLQGLPPSLRTGFGGALTATTGASSDDEDVSENEYEEIQDVARYMNSASIHNPPPPPPDSTTCELLITGVGNTKKSGSINSGSSPDGNYEYDSVHPNYDDVGIGIVGSCSTAQSESLNLVSATTSTNNKNNSGGEGDLNGNTSKSDETNNESVNVGGRRSPPLGPPRHFKSFSSTDDILAEVVQVQQKHDRVLDQLNLEVENLLIRSTKEIEQNEVNSQRSHVNSMMMLRSHSHHHHHHHQQQQEGDLNQCSGANCYYCSNGNNSTGSSQGAGTIGSCQNRHQNHHHQQQQQMCSGPSSSSSGDPSSSSNNMNNNPNTNKSEEFNEGVNNGNGSSSGSGSCNCCCCCGCCGSYGELGNYSAVAPSSSKDKSSNWRESLKQSLLSGFHNHSHHGPPHSNLHSSSASVGEPTASKGNAESKLSNGHSASALTSSSNGTFSRKKKLDRNAPTQLSDTNLKHKLNTLSAIKSHNEQYQLSKGEKGSKNSSSCTSLCMEECALVGSRKNNMNLIHYHHHHTLHHNGGSAGVTFGKGGGGWKGRYQRSNSLIPNWKIRDHLMRLPFLRQNKDKLKKGDSLIGVSSSSLHAATGGVPSTKNTNGGGNNAVPKSISGVDFSPSSQTINPSSSALFQGYNKNLQQQQQQCGNHHHHHHHQHLHNPLMNLNGNSNPTQQNNMSSSSTNGDGCAVTAAATTCSSSSSGNAALNTNPNLKLVRSSSMDELRPTEEHWYSADSDTEPDSLTAIIPPPSTSTSAQLQSTEGASSDKNNCCRGSHNNNGDDHHEVNSVEVVTVIEEGIGDKCCAGGNCCTANNQTGGDLGSNVVGNIYTNSPNGVNVNNIGSSNSTTSSSSINNNKSSSNGNGCGGGGGLGHTENGSRMDVVSSTIIPDAPKAPKFRRGTQGLKDKWRESWSHSKTLSKNNMEDENRLLRWFSLRKNSATLETSVGSANTNHRHSTLPQLTEEDLKRISFLEDEEGYWPRRPVQPPSLPPPPPDLSSDQITRRHIIAAIVHSENNYVAALQRLVNEYKKALECSHPAMLSHSKISAIFHRVPEILQCHSLFRIALAECVRRWDTEEKIGDVFVASFSKSLVLDVYSEFINNFGTAMETAKVEARRKSAFAEFLKVKQMTAHDRLSLFGLMVKPVQRFPQFILLLQDLLKHTPKDHHDRMSLQLALTQLESLAAMLNERKRESEQYQAFKETIKSISGGKFVLLRNAMDDPNRILLRQDVVTQLEFDSNGGTVAKSKCRKLLLLNDMLICTTLANTSSSSFTGVGDHNILNRKNSSGHIVLSEETSNNASSTNGNGSGNSGGGNSSSGHQNSSSGKAEKCMFKWSFPVREVEVEDISISPTMSRFVQMSGAGAKGKSTAEDKQSLILLEEMQSLMHDYEVLSRVLTLVQSLKSSYEGLTEQSVKELMLEIQHQIQRRDEQISYFDSSCLTLLLGSGSNREKVTFQMQSPQARNEWIEELRLAQLALDPSNSPAWDVPLESPYPLHKLPLFVRALSVCKSPQLTTVKCGCYFTHTFVSQTGRSKILDYLWISSTDGMSSHVTAFRSQENVLKEVSSFDLVEEKVNDLLFVMGHIWMGTESRKIMVYDPSDPDKGNIGQYLLSDSILKLTLYNSVIYAGLADGNLAVFTDLSNPRKNLRPECIVKLGADRIPSIFGSKDFIYAACGNAVVTIDAKTHTVERSVVLTHHNGPISHMACSGVGLWIATQESGTVCLYHLESLQHLQDVSIAPSVFRTVRDSFRRAKGVHVTCLMAHKGWLWIGTNLGVILTIPLPRLEGVPIISTGNANVSFHGFIGPVSFLMPLMKPPPALLPLTSSSTSGHQKQKQQKSRHQTEFKEQNVAPEVVKDDSYIEMTSPKSPPNDSAAKSPEPVIMSSDELSGGELCLSSSMNQGNKENERLAASVSFSTHPNESSINGKDGDLAEYVNMSNDNDNDEDKHDSLSSVPSQDSSPSAFNQVDGGNASDRSSCNSMERGVTPISSASSPSTSVINSKTLVVLRKKSSKDNVFLRNCKTLPRGGGPIPSRFSIESDVYGLYGNLINVRGLEDEGRFVDPLYDALRRSDPELNALDAKISTLDRRLKMRMSRPRSLDLSNWSVDSKISASSDESVGLGSRSSQQTTDSNGTTPVTATTNNLNGSHNHHHHHHRSPVSPPNGDTNDTAGNGKQHHPSNNNNNGNQGTGATKKTLSRQKHKSVKGPQERTVLVVVGGRGYVNMRNQSHPDQFLSNLEAESKSCTHLTLWQMKT